MRESISESWTIQIVAAFILLFVAFFALIISYSKCFKVKNEVVSIIEKYEGLTADSEKIIKEYLVSTNYKGYGNCPTTDILESNYKGYEEVNTGSNKYKYCIKANLVSNGTLVNYEVVLFYSFYIPVFGNIATFEVKGTTIDLNNTNYYKTIFGM